MTDLFVPKPLPGMPDAIAPTRGPHAGVPMAPDSALAQAIRAHKRETGPAKGLHPSVAAPMGPPGFPGGRPAPEGIGTGRDDRRIVEAASGVKKSKKRRVMPAQTPGDSEQNYPTDRRLIRAIERDRRFGPLVWDLAANETNAVCDLWIGEEQDSLRVNWSQLSTGLLWLNPPFGNIAPWARKCALESQRGARILFLTPASVGSNWYWDHVAENALVLALTPRLVFEGETDPYPKDCILSCFGFGVTGLYRWQWRSVEGKRGR